MKFQNLSIKSCPASLVAALAFLGGLSPRAAEGTIIGTSVQNGNGSYSYSYTIDNTAGTFDIFSWSLDLGLSVGEIDWNQLDVAQGGDVTTPGDPFLFTDWSASQGIPVSGNTAQDFLANDPFGAGDVLVGSTLSGFSFTSFNAPGPVDYYEFSPFGASASGTTLGPVPGSAAAVPESGSSLVMLALGILGFGLIRSGRTLVYSLRAAA